MNRLPHIHGAESEQEEDAPIVLPRLVFRAQNDAVFALTVDGIDHDSLRDPSHSPVVGRAELGTVIASLAEQAGTAVRVEVHESDGTVHADIIEPPPSPDSTSGSGGWVGPEGFLPRRARPDRCRRPHDQGRPGRTAAPTAPAATTRRRFAERPVRAGRRHLPQGRHPEDELS
jgi:hypothetical protein